MLAQVEEPDFDDILGTNLLGLMEFSYQVADIMKKQVRGHLINIASKHAMRPDAGTSVYSMTKAAVKGFSQQLACWELIIFK